MEKLRAPANLFDLFQLIRMVLDATERTVVTATAFCVRIDTVRSEDFETEEFGEDQLKNTNEKSRSPNDEGIDIDCCRR